LVSFLNNLFNIKAYRLTFLCTFLRGIEKFKFDIKKEILIISLIFSENDPPVTAFENNLAALSELFAAQHLGTPGLNELK